jgi:hypothetical protein
MAFLAETLQIRDEFDDLCARSPNMIVSAKVLIAVVARVDRLSDFQKAGLLDLERGMKH